MKRTIKVRLDIDPSITETEVIIRSTEETESTRSIASMIRDYVIREEAGKTPIEGNVLCYDSTLLALDLKRIKKSP